MARFEDILIRGDRLRNRWLVRDRIGGGGFGQIYQAHDELKDEEVAIKVEPIIVGDSSRQVLRMEVVVLRSLQGKIHAAKLYASGVSPKYNFIVMEYLSRNLGELRRSSPLHRFSVGTTFRLAVQALEAICDLHETGFLHRDIKPSNFTVGLKPENKRIVYLVDFGLARQFMSSKGEIRPPREHAGFRGTARYASLNTHQGKDVGRHDDLWSLFYMIVEMGRGFLPWRKTRERRVVFEMKMAWSLEKLCEDLPELTIWFARKLVGLSYYDRPDYKTLDRFLREVVDGSGEDMEEDCLDWEDGFRKVHEEEAEKRRLKEEKGIIHKLRDTCSQVSGHVRGRRRGICRLKLFMSY